MNSYIATLVNFAVLIAICCAWFLILKVHHRMKMRAIRRKWFATLPLDVQEYLHPKIKKHLH